MDPARTTSLGGGMQTLARKAPTFTEQKTLIHVESNDPSESSTLERQHLRNRKRVFSSEKNEECNVIPPDGGGGGSPSRVTLTVSSENQSRFSCKELTHQAWVNASSPASNSPAAMETKCCHGHNSELQQVLDLLLLDASPVPTSDVAWHPFADQIASRLRGSSVPAFSERPTSGDSSHHLALLRRTITWKDGNDEECLGCLDVVDPGR